MIAATPTPIWWSIRSVNGDGLSTLTSVYNKEKVVEDIYKAPDAELVSEEDPAKLKSFFTVSSKKLVLMYIVTMGLYALVYFYEHWKAQKIKYELKVIPVLRAVFAIFFVHSLFSKIKKEAEDKGLSDLPALSGLATLFVVLSIVSTILSNVPGEGMGAVVGSLLSIILSVIALIPLLKAQKVANVINDDEEGQANATLTGVNWIFIILGVLFWLMSLFSLVVLLMIPPQL